MMKYLKAWLDWFILLHRWFREERARCKAESDSMKAMYPTPTVREAKKVRDATRKAWEDGWIEKNRSHPHSYDRWRRMIDNMGETWEERKSRVESNNLRGDEDE